MSAHYHGRHWSWVRADRLQSDEAKHALDLAELCDPERLAALADADGTWIHLLLHFEHPAHALSKAILDELGEVLSAIEKERDVVGLLVWSTNPRHFIAGADITEIREVKDEAEALRIVESAQRQLDRLSALPYPSVAVIRGSCLGGGLELALACRYRIAVDAPSTKLGLPEVNLGIIPGFGGTQRLPRLIGLRSALGLMAAATRLPAAAAWRKGLADLLVPPEGFVATATRAAAKLVAAPKAVKTRRKKLRKGWVNAVLEGTPFGRSLVRRGAKKRVLSRTGGHYPAPLELVDVTIDGYASDLRAGLDLEAKAVSRLVPTDVSKQLIRIFLASEEAKKVGSDAEAARIESVGVIGAGVMGAGIAELFLERQIATRLRDLDWDRIQPALERIGERLETKVKRKRMTPLEREQTLARLTFTTELVGFQQCDLVVEAAVEKLEIKQKIFADLERATRPDAILATNTSALSISDIQESSEHPTRVVGLHFFNPVERMPLVEVIPGTETSPEVTAAAARAVVALGKYPVVVQDAPGFLVNRLLSPYLNAACHLLEAGVSGPDIDAAAREFGLPMGPFRLLDEVGFDIAIEVAHTLHQAFGARFTPSAVLDRWAKDDRLGTKTGRGFYRYGRGKPTWDPAVTQQFPTSVERSRTEIIDALLDPLLDEAARCLEENVVARAIEVDLAMVMGTGFPPFRGGPLAWAESRSLTELVERIDARSTESKREPSDALKRVADQGRFAVLDREVAAVPSRDYS